MAWGFSLDEKLGLRRTTERARAAYLEVQDREVTGLERAAPRAPAGPAVLLLSVDGAMAPLLGKQWTEVKTLAKLSSGCANKQWRNVSSAIHCCLRQHRKLACQ
jgi:hypothetical protein